MPPQPSSSPHARPPQLGTQVGGGQCLAAMQALPPPSRGPQQPDAQSAPVEHRAPQAAEPSSKSTQISSPPQRGLHALPASGAHAETPSEVGRQFRVGHSASDVQIALQIAGASSHEISTCPSGQSSRPALQS